MKKLNLFLVLATAVLLTACSGKSAEEKKADEGATPWFGKILNSYKEQYLAGNSGVDFRGIIDAARQEALRVEGSPYGISCSKAVINEYNVQDNCINIIMELVPNEGTDFHLDGYKGIGYSGDYGPYGKFVQAQARGGEHLIYARTCHCNKGKMLVTLHINNEDLQVWKTLDHIRLVEKTE
jgi:hypothetical protein